MRISSGSQTADLGCARNCVGTPRRPPLSREADMMRAAFALLILALAAGILGITGLAGTWSETGEVLFLALMVMFLVMLMSGQRPRPDATDWHTPTSWALDV